VLRLLSGGFTISLLRSSPPSCGARSILIFILK